MSDVCENYKVVNSAKEVERIHGQPMFLEGMMDSIIIILLNSAK